MHLGEELGDRIEVMRRDAAGYEIETLVIERQRLGLGEGDTQIAETAPRGFDLHLVEHFLGDIGCPHARHMRREGIGDMPAAGGNVEDTPGSLRRGESDKAFEALALGVGFGSQVMGGVLAELVLDEGLAHGGAPCEFAPLIAGRSPGGYRARGADSFSESSGAMRPSGCRGAQKRPLMPARITDTLCTAMPTPALIPSGRRRYRRSRGGRCRTSTPSVRPRSAAKTARRRQWRTSRRAARCRPGWSR